LVDTNLLVGFLVGRFNPTHLINCRATKAFAPDDFQLLVRFLSRFDKLITTPHILTEVSNLAGKLPDDLIEGFRMTFGQQVKSLAEQPMKADKIVDNSEFPRFGLTDTAVRMIAPGKYLVLTDELPLYQLLCKRNVDVINFNHIRHLGWED
jgi:hypothetical protein